jgi:hypothetical protein
MALAKEGLAAAAADVAAAAVLGQAFCGVETDVGPAVEAMARWEWLMGLRGHYREECLLAEALAVKPRGEIVALAALLAAAVAADTRHLEAFGTPWDDPGFDADSVAVFEDCVARIAAVAGSVADPFAAVFHAFRAAAKGERAKAVLAALSGDMPEDPAEVLDRRCAALSHALNALHPGGEFAFRAAQVGDLRAACAAGHAAACGFAEAVVDLCNVADAELVSFDKPIADAADRLRVIEAAPLLLATRRRTAARAAALRMPAAPAGATPAVPSIPDVAMPEGDIWEEFDLHGGRERRPVGGA